MYSVHASCFCNPHHHFRDVVCLCNKKGTPCVGMLECLCEDNFFMLFDNQWLTYCKQCHHSHLSCQHQYEGCSESNAPHFFLGNYLLRMYEIHTQYNWMFPLHALFSHIISIYVYGLTPARNKEMHAFMYQLASYSRSHALTARITLLSSSNFVPSSASFSDQKDENLTAPDQGGGAQSNGIWRLPFGCATSVRHRRHFHRLLQRR